GLVKTIHHPRIVPQLPEIREILAQPVRSIRATELFRLSYAGLTRVSIDLRKGALFKDGLPGQARQ
ncbi:hypothetical protein AAFX91_10690, partial [Bradyrhizobium sp. 31Argb]|uniref:hypothetical protein n=1 Tax=Bradyrhizobium sp. 31Argb TaxID=3141247 RepID=UPI00374A1024